MVNPLSVNDLSILVSDWIVKLTIESLERCGPNGVGLCERLQHINEVGYHAYKGQVGLEQLISEIDDVELDALTRACWRYLENNK